MLPPLAIPIVLALCVAEPAAASSAPAPSASPAELRAALPLARPAGSARLTVWGFDVYDATLHVPPAFDADDWARQPFALELRYLRGFDRDAIAQRSIDEMQRAAPMAAAQSGDWLDRMRAVFPDVKKGDRLLGIHQPGKGARFFHNGMPVGAVEDPLFAERFFGIWLGDRTSEPKLRDALLRPTTR